jgi:hypothetical protein
LEVPVPCNCDIDFACDSPACVAEREAEAAHYRQLFATPTLKLTREEWADVYSNNAGKALAYPKEFAA